MMKTRIKTPIGYLNLPDERMAENAKAIYSGMYQEKDIEEIVITTPETRMNYNTSSPFGCGYTNNYERVLSSRTAVIKMCCGKVERDITFVEAV